MSSGSNREISLEGQLVKIIPVQTDRHHRDLSGAEKLMKRRWKPVVGRYFSKNLTAKKLIETLKEANVNPDNFLVMEHEGFIAYRYKDKPLIALNIKDGQFYTTQQMIESHGLDYVQQQAYIIVEILKNMFISSC